MNDSYLFDQHIEGNGECLLFAFDLCFDGVRNVLKAFWDLGIDSKFNGYALLAIVFITM